MPWISQESKLYWWVAKQSEKWHLNRKNGILRKIKSVKMNISKNKTFVVFFLMSHGSSKLQVSWSKGVLCSLVTDGQTHKRKWIQRTPIQGFRNFSFNLSSRIGPICIFRRNRKIFFLIIIIDDWVKLPHLKVWNVSRSVR